MTDRETPELGSETAGPKLDRAEKKKSEEEQSLNASVTYEVVRRQGLKELNRTTSALAWSGLAAGLSMGFSMVAEGLLQAHLPAAPWRPLISKFGYGVGFLVVILGSQQLFTENTLVAIIPLLAERTRAILTRVARLWIVVFFANMAGAAIFAVVVGRTELFTPDVREAFREIGLHAMRSGFAITLLRAIFAGWLVALMVWMLPAAEGAYLNVIVIVTYLIGIGGFAHIVAGAVEVFYLVAVDAVSLGRAISGFIIPTLIGNVIGGVALVAAVNHAQVVSGGVSAQQ